MYLYRVFKDAAELALVRGKNRGSRCPRAGRLQEAQRIVSKAGQRIGVENHRRFGGQGGHHQLTHRRASTAAGSQHDGVAPSISH
jgi:hypothetical protein